ncbi:outer membrane protein [Limnohabitans sp. G3-2]|uniref:outer membrane protein n=1 Tax=Limnohabitans sp. G3-2 TaxID=1100711 RepID=UPI000C1F82DB|nr:outer membrane beta-barrel protein [Limnohabitans sp. G3-2]PIT76845.1 hypothetical protein B9Z31_02410 [Limnohabitans sp. G3-2]
MKKILLGALFSVFTCPLFSQSVFKGFYIEGFLGTQANKPSPSSDYAGASGYVCSNCPTGKMGNVATNSQMTFGAKIGYKFSDSIRSDLSYYRVNFGKTTWGTDFNSFNGTYNQSNATPFSASLKSDTFLASVYYTLPLNNGLNPYIGAGIGPSINSMGTVNEGNYNSPKGGTQLALAYKFDIGLMYDISQELILDLGVGLINTGNFSSGTTRNNNEVIAPYKFNGQLNPIATLGLVYKF